MKTIVIGTSGYIGHALWEEYRKIWPDLPLLDHKREEKVRLESPRFDLLPYGYPEYQWAVVAQGMPRIAFCEREKQLSYQCNVTGTLTLIDQIRKKGMIPIILSSDYVFDGVTGGYVEDSPLNPLNEYGRQKAAVEEALPRICGQDYLLLRLGKVAGKELKGRTLLTEIMQQLFQGVIVRAAYDQQMSPIFLEDVVQGIQALQKIHARGGFHLCGREIWNRLELARSIAKSLKLDERLVQSISLDDLGESFLRPKRTDMSCKKFLKATGYPLNSIRYYIETLGEQVHASRN